MDLIVDELGGVVVNNVHAGASAQASRRGARWKKRLGPYGFGILGYPIGAVLASIKPPFVRMRIEVDGQVVADVDEHILMVSIGNGASVGGGTELTPDADPTDGLLDVMISRATGPVERIAYAAALYSGRHPERDDVTALRARQITVTGEDFWLSADGEIQGPERRRAWHLEQGAYSMVVPPAAGCERLDDLPLGRGVGPQGLALLHPRVAGVGEVVAGRGLVGAVVDLQRVQHR